MLRVRVLHHVHSDADNAVLKQVEDIARVQFPLATKVEIAEITRRLREPMVGSFMPMLLVIEDLDGRISAFASVLLIRPLKLAHLELISTAPKRPGGGLGSLLYERVREECLAQGCHGLVFECLPDEPGPSRDEATLKINKQRLKFYEFYGARPLINTGYEGPSKSEEDIGAYLVLDPLDTEFQLPLALARQYVAAFLAYKYPRDCPPDVIARVIAKFTDDPIQQRAPRYFRSKDKLPVRVLADRPQYAIVINDHHDIHHVRDRGYVEAPVRISKIRDELNKTKLFVELAEEPTAQAHLTAVHSVEYVNYLKRICLNLPEKKSVYPQVFPVRNRARPPKDLAMQAGYYCIDTFTPLNKNAYLAARGAVDCALTAANAMLDRYSMAYALVRPPGHHAERSAFGGFCYFNSSAVAAHYLSRYGKIAVLDVDFHHGNGTQNIFYERDDVFTVSIHGNPTEHYPFFSGFSDETGEGNGAGFNLNIPLPSTITPERYRTALKQAITAVRKFAPDYLVLALGLDTAKSDPTGSWALEPDDFRQNGYLLAGLKLRTLVVQEGGYRTRTLGQNARAFFEGFYQGQTAGKLEGSSAVKPHAKNGAKPEAKPASKSAEKDAGGRR